MSRFIFFFILQRLVIATCLFAAPLSMMQDGKLISEIGKLFGEVIRELTQPEPEPAAAMEVGQFMDAAPPKLAPGEADRKKHADRIGALAGVIQSWVTQICELDETQQTQLQNVVADNMKVEVDRYAQKGDPQRANRQFGLTTPLLFVYSDDGRKSVNGRASHNVGSNFSKTLLKAIEQNILNESQTNQLRIALEARTEFQNAAFQEYVVTLFDQELFLTADQRQKMLEQFSESSKKITSPFYSFIAQDYYLPNKSLSELLSPGKAGFLDSRQKERLKDLQSGNGNQNYIMFQSSEGAEQWDETVKQAVSTQRERYLNAAAVRIGFLERSLKLTPDQVAHLTVASKGATTEAIADWKVSTHKTIDQMKQQMAQMQGNFAFSAQNVSVDGLDKNEIWASAIREVNADKQSGERSDVIRRSYAVAAVALLDQEMWLTPGQRTTLLEATEVTMPRNYVKSEYDEYVRELILIVYPLHNVKESKVQEILSERQQDVWIILKAYFQFNGGNRNNVLIPLGENGGTFPVQLAE